MSNLITNINFSRVSNLQYELILDCSEAEDINQIVEQLNELKNNINELIYKSESPLITVALHPSILPEFFQKLIQLNLLDNKINSAFLLKRMVKFLIIHQLIDPEIYEHIDNFLRFYNDTKNAITHTFILQKLLSREVGILVLLQLIEKGLILFNSTYYPRNLTGEAIKTAGEILGLKSRTGHITEFITPQKLLAITTSNLENDNEIDAFYTDSFLVTFINKYLFKNEEASKELIDKQENHILALLDANQVVKASQYFTIAQFTGLSYNSATDLTFFSTITSGDFAALKRKYQFILDHYKLADAKKFYACRYIAVQVIIILFERNFYCNEDEITNLIVQQYKAIPEVERLHDKSSFLEYTLHAVIQLASIIAPRLGKAANLSPFINLSKKADSILRIYTRIPNEIEISNDPAIDLKKCYPVIQKISEITVQEEYFKVTLKQIDQLFSSSLKLAPFFNYLNRQLSKQISHLPDLPASCIENKIKLFDMSFPSGEGFRWWSTLPAEQKSLHQAMHLTLLELENRAGYNLPYPDGTEGVPRFYGFIPPERVYTLVTQEKRIFKESSYFFPGIIHGIDAHRLQLAALRFFIDNKTIVLPPEKNVHDLITYIFDKELWPDIFDSVGTLFMSPHYLMTYLRNASQYEALQKYAVFNFFKSIQKAIHMNCSFLNYEQLVLIQSAHDENFLDFSQENLFINWLQVSGHKVDFKEQNGLLWSATYFKKPGYKQTPKSVFNQVHAYIEDNYPPSNFTGRATVLQQIRHRFSDSSSIQIICGMRGIGKSALVNHYIENSNYAVYWSFDLTKLNESVNKLFNLINRSYPQLIRDISSQLTNSSQFESIKILKLALQKIPNWLLIFDNAHDESEIKNFLPLQTPGMRQHILITTINPHWPNNDKEIIKLGAFSNEEAFDYLKKVLPKEDNEQLLKLSNAYANFPLALKLSGDFLKSTGINCAEYLKFNTECRVELWDQHERTIDYKYTLSTVWLNDIQQCIGNPYAQAILYCLPFLNTKTFYTTTFSALGDGDIKHALIHLESYSLIEYSPSSKQYHCHPLVQLALYDHLSTNEKVKYAKLALVLAPELCDLEVINRLDEKILVDYKNNSQFNDDILSELNFNEIVSLSDELVNLSIKF